MLPPIRARLNSRAVWHLLTGAILFGVLGVTSFWMTVSPAFKVTYQLFTPVQWGYVFCATAAVKLLVLIFRPKVNGLLFAATVGTFVATMRLSTLFGSYLWVRDHPKFFPGISQSSLYASLVASGAIWLYIAANCFLTALWAGQDGLE